MSNVIKVGIIWIIMMMFAPFGLGLIQIVNTPFSIFIAFVVLTILILLTIFYLIQDIKGFE